MVHDLTGRLSIRTVHGLAIARRSHRGQRRNVDEPLQPALRQRRLDQIAGPLRVDLEEVGRLARFDDAGHVDHCVHALHRRLQGLRALDGPRRELHLRQLVQDILVALRPDQGPDHMPLGGQLLGHVRAQKP